MLERLDRGPLENAYIGKQYNASEIQDIIFQKRWPKAQCKTCGKAHDASIRKVCESESGGEFQFCEPDCPDAASSETKE